MCSEFEYEAQYVGYRMAEYQTAYIAISVTQPCSDTSVWQLPLEMPTWCDAPQTQYHKIIQCDFRDLSAFCHSSKNAIESRMP